MAAVRTTRVTSRWTRSTSRRSTSSRWPGPIRPTTTSRTSSARSSSTTSIYVLAQQQLARRARRDHRPGNLDSRRAAGHRAARHQLLGKQRSLGSPAAVSDEQLSAGDRRADGQVDHDVRQRRRRQSARGPRTRSGDDREDAVVESRQGVREPDHSRDRPPARTTWRLPAIFAPTMSSPASSCGSSTPFRIPASSATTRGRRMRGSTSAASTRGVRSRSIR